MRPNNRNQRSGVGLVLNQITLHITAMHFPHSGFLFLLPLGMLEGVCAYGITRTHLRPDVTGSVGWLPTCPAMVGISAISLGTVSSRTESLFEKATEIQSELNVLN